MKTVDLEETENKLSQLIQKLAPSSDPAHDFLHFQRVVNLAKSLCQAERGDPQVVIPAAWLHDCVIIPKDNPLRNQASRLSAQETVKILETLNYPSSTFASIAHAIEAHSFSANIEARTVEAQIVQDADRLDGLGAIGIARCFSTAGLLKRPFYSGIDPFCESRTPNDAQYTLDHFYQKLYKTAETLKTKAGRAEGQKRLQTMNQFIESLRQEITAS